MKKHYLYKLLAIILFALFVISIYFYVDNAIEYHIRYYFYELYSCKNCNMQTSSKEPDSKMVYISFFAMMIAGFGTLSTLIFSLIKERRETKETKLRMEKLEIEIAELKFKNEATKP